MNIVVNRQACCAQDDQLGPLSIELVLSDECTVEELALMIIRKRFLQFSSSHSVMAVHSGNRNIFNIPSQIGINMNTEFFVPLNDLAKSYITKNEIDCTWLENL